MARDGAGSRRVAGLRLPGLRLPGLRLPGLRLPGLMLPGLMLTVALALSACGSSSPSTTATTPPRAPVVPGSTTTAISTGTAVATPVAVPTTAVPTTPRTTVAVPPTTATTVPLTRCATDGLIAGISSPAGIPGGLLFILSLYNAGSSPCTLQGYPGVSFVDGPVGLRIGAPARRLAPDFAGVVVVAPGARAEARVSVAYAGSFTAACSVTAVLGFRVYPPDTTTSLFVPRVGRTCANPGYVTLGVGAVHAP